MCTVSIGGDGHAHGSGNPHYWLDPRNAEIITANIQAALASIDPAHAEAYAGQPLCVSLAPRRQLKNWDETACGPTGIPLVATTTAWPYFGAPFSTGVHRHGGAEAGRATVAGPSASLIGVMNARGARIIVRQPHEPEKDAAFVVQRTGGMVACWPRRLAPCQAADDYLSLFDVNVTALRAAAGVRDGCSRAAVAGIRGGDLPRRHPYLFRH